MLHHDFQNFPQILPRLSIGGRPVCVLHGVHSSISADLTQLGSRTLFQRDPLRRADQAARSLLLQSTTVDIFANLSQCVHLPTFPRSFRPSASDNDPGLVLHRAILAQSMKMLTIAPQARHPRKSLLMGSSISCQSRRKPDAVLHHHFRSRHTSSESSAPHRPFVHGLRSTTISQDG